MLDECQMTKHILDANELIHENLCISFFLSFFTCMWLIQISIPNYEQANICAHFLGKIPIAVIRY